ncbi:MAG: pseudouridine synthase [Gammaproteobacteria bacterium]|nr:pseudouridine synthase [Gammaproteobacteria bacterium]
MAERIQKVLANAGVGSRREIERWIAEGRVAVDGKPAALGQSLSGRERIVIDGRPLRLQTARPASHRYLAYYKTAGELTTKDDPERRSTVFDQLPRPKHGRWISVGRLDMNTSGLLLFVTDGELAHRLMHPRFEISREYAVRLLGDPSEDQWKQLVSGVVLEDGPARFEHVEARGGEGRNTWYHVTLKEGRNREVRRMFDAMGLTVSRLLRVRYGPIELGRLRRGGTRELSDGEIAALYAAVDLPNPRRAPAAPKSATGSRNPSKPRSFQPAKPRGAQPGNGRSPQPGKPRKPQPAKGRKPPSRADRDR